MWTVFVALLAGFSTAPTGNVAATVNGRTILVSEIDTPSQAKIAQLREDLSALATRTVDRLVDVHLRALAPAAQHVMSPLPRITDEEIRAFRATHAKDFEGPLAPSGKANGLTWDRQGRLLCCEHANSRVSRIAADGRATVIASVATFGGSST